MNQREINEAIVGACLKHLNHTFKGEGTAEHDSIAVFHVLDTPEGADPDHGVKVLFNGCDKHALPHIMQTMAKFNPALVDVMLKTAIELKIKEAEDKHKAAAQARKN